MEIVRNPLVTVFLTSYNQGKYLREAIDSVLRQTFTDFELILSDDASTDDSWEIIQSYHDPRIIKRRNKTNQGYQLSYEVIDCCRGKYFAMHHSDDAWEPDKLEKQVAFMESHPEYAACFTKVNFIDEESKIWDLPAGHIYEKVFEQENRTKEEWLRHFFYKGNCLCHPSMVIRKEKYRAYDLLAPFGLVQLPDFIRWVKLALHENIHVYPAYLTRFRIRRNRQENVSADNPEAQIRSQYELIKIYEQFSYISTVEQMLKVFPEAEEYLVDGKMNIAYALARLLYRSNIPSAWLVANHLLMRELNDPTGKAQLAELYSYDYKSFAQDTAAHDVFFTRRYLRFINAQLFIDVSDGNGIDGTHVMNITGYVQNDNSYYLEYDVSSYPTIKAVRFDPHDSAIAIQGNEVFADEVRLIARWDNADVKHKDPKEDVFYTDDPMYFYELGERSPKKIIVKGFVARFIGYEEMARAKEKEVVLKYENSMSWKITAPLRKLKQLF